MRRRLQRAGLSWYNQSDITKEGIAMQEPTAALPGSDKRVSRIFLGLASPPYTAGEQNKLLDEMFDLGITAFDAARVYRGAEECLGAWVAARGNRDKIFIETKCAHPSVFGRSRVDDKSIRKDAERSLRALRTDYIDLLLLHRDDERLPVSSMVEALGALYKEGKVRAFGASNWRHERIAAANAYAKEQGLPPFAASSVHFGLAEQVENPWPGACVSVTGEGEQAARDWYKDWTALPAAAIFAGATWSGSAAASSWRPKKAPPWRRSPWRGPSKAGSTPSPCSPRPAPRTCGRTWRRCLCSFPRRNAAG